MFSCCALFSQAEDPADVEHLKALDEVEADKEGEISIDVDGVDTARGPPGDFEGTPLPSSPRVLAAQQTAAEAASAARKAESEVVQAKIGMSRSEVEEKAAAEKEALAQQAARAAEADAKAAEEARAAAQAEAETATAERTEQTMRALREAEDAAHAAAAEAEKRRFEEEASARAARQAESEARKALWRAEEAQRVKEAAGSKAAEEAAAVHRIAQEEVRKGTDPDPAFPGETGTSDLRRAKSARAALGSSFSLLFPSRSLDFTVNSKAECEQLVLGFRALQQAGGSRHRSEH
eukprot:g7786.t1